MVGGGGGREPVDDLLAVAEVEGGGTYEGLFGAKKERIEGWACVL